MCLKLRWPSTCGDLSSPSTLASESSAFGQEDRKRWDGEDTPITSSRIPIGGNWSRDPSGMQGLMGNVVTGWTAPSQPPVYTREGGARIFCGLLAILPSLLLPVHRAPTDEALIFLCFLSANPNVHNTWNPCLCCSQGPSRLHERWSASPSSFRCQLAQLQSADQLPASMNEVLLAPGP